MNARNPERRKEAPRRTRMNGSPEGMNHRDLVTKNALVWSSVTLMLGVAAAVVAELVGR